MENENNAGSDAIERQCIRNLNLRGQKVAAFVIRHVGEDLPHATAEGLAIVFEAAAKGIADEAAFLRGRGVR